MPAPSTRCAPRPSSCRPGRSATPAPGSRSSAPPASPATPGRRSPTPPRCTGTPASPPRLPAHPVGPGRGLRRTGRLRRRAGRGHRRDQLQPVPGRRVPAGLLTHADRAVRDRAIAHHAECVEVMRATGSTDLKLWLPDGTNYAGQDDLRARQDRLADSLQQIYALLDPEHRLLVEYKIYEPYFYAMDIPDWGTSLVHCLALGDQAQVVLDTGHHAPSTNIEFIVMQLLRVGRLGAFDFNSRNYGDDDLIVGAADPFQLFRIMNEIVEADALGRAGDGTAGVNFMLDQCHNIEPKIPGQIRSVTNVQEATAKALLVDRDALHTAQQAGDVLGAHAALTDAFATDVRPLLAELRESAGLHPDPNAAYAASGHQDQLAADRVGGTQASWGA
ncbi:L-rhamnose isomerase [Klenkia terrae]|uniref:L-rhamnose isomerase n=1 Tax=Klenkia terrae TaxID=1052259 RepID=UPI0036161267